MHQRQRVALASAGAVVLFLAVQVGALALVGPFEDAGYRTVENPQNPTNSLLYVGALLAVTALMLAVIKLGRERVLRWVVVLTGGLISWYVFSVVVAPLAAVAGAVAVVVALLVHPEWYVIDAAGVLMGMGAAALFGISFGVLPAIVLLVALAVYDAISVYRTEHMLTLASGVMRLRVPVLFVLPTRLDYSFLDESGEMEQREAATDGAPAADRDGDDGEAERASGDGDEVPAGLDRDAIFVGLGDAVMPTIMAASAAVFVDAPTVLGTELPALCSVVGTQLGLLVLLRMVLEGRPHAGLPLLNGGAIGGYLVGALLSGISLVRAVGLGPYV